MIKAIETRYAGYRFRSRLEARWAIFLDRLEINWEYEAQGFETSAGPYLPDFHVSATSVLHTVGGSESWNNPTAGEVFLEVKGAPLRQDEAEKLRAFASDPGEPRWIMALGNIPHPDTALHYLQGWGMGGAGRCDISIGRLSFESAHSMSDKWGATQPRLMDHAFQMNSYLNPPDVRGRMHQALTAARSARFEHGENG